MTVTSFPTVQPRKPRTAAQRKAESRRRAKERAAAAVTPPDAAPLPPDAAPLVTPPRPDPGPVTVATARRDCPGPAVTAVTLAAALGLAACSASFSIAGMTAIFAGAVMPVTAMGVAFEAGKLCGVAWLGRSRHAPLSLRVAVTLLILAFVALNSAGVFGFLSRANLSRVADQIAIDHRAVLIEGDIVVAAEAVADLDRRIFQLDSVIDSATARGRTKTALEIIADQSRARAELVGQRQSASKKLVGLKVQRDAVAGEGRQIEVDVGPIKYLATLIGATDDQTLRASILIVSLILDPAAVLLMLAASYRRRSP
jgi:hypothetical protein